MQRFKYINQKGTEIDFNETAPFVFWKLEGLGIPDVTPISTQSAGQNGYTLHQIVFEPRYIKLTGHIHGKSGVKEMYALRQKLQKELNPALGMGTIIYENDNGIWQIPAFVSSDPYTWKMKEFQTLDLNFVCPGTFWMSKNSSQVLLSYVDGGMKFPVATPGYFGMLGYLAKIDNDSDDELPIEMYMDGGAYNPVILNKSTGEFFKLNKNIPAGESLYINTDPEHLEVSLIYTDPVTNIPAKTNAYGYLTTDSTLLRLKQGLNELTFTSDDDSKTVKIRILFYKRYLGL